MKRPLSHRRTGAFSLGEFLCVITVIGVLALAVLAILWRKPLLIPTSSSPAPTNALASKTPTQPVQASAPPPNQPVSAPASSPVAVVAPQATSSAFEDFSGWVKLFTNSSASLVEGQRLAWKRREAMLDLIQNDPKRAIELSMSFELRQTLSPQITKFFEQQVDGRGDFLLAVGTDFSSGNTTTYRQVQLGGNNYEAFVYGRRRSQVSQT